MKDLGIQLFKAIEKCLNSKEFLAATGLSKTRIKNYLAENGIKAFLTEREDLSTITYSEMIDAFAPLCAEISPVPEEGWLAHLCRITVDDLFDNEKITQENEYTKGADLLWSVLDSYTFFRKESLKFNPLEDLNYLTDDEVEEFDVKDEYKRLKRISRKLHLYTFMKLEKELTGFDTIGHVFGVHHVAMHVAKQLYKCGVPVDLALVSGSAVSHDIGKFGCKGEEVKRIPYLHYYYTSKCLNKFKLPIISHIASNHSTWDLELENLSVESLILIFADFRVKSKWVDGKENIIFYSLDEAYEIIMNKLDNLDDKKKARYDRVYTKLKDFERFMVSLGVSVDLDDDQVKEVPYVDTALLSPAKVIDRIKYRAFEYNINVMHKMRNEVSFGSILEDARGEKNWNDIRAYISTLDEYFTYMTRRQKIMTLDFLFDMLMHREGDVRRQAARLTGKIISAFQEEYRKELPDSVSVEDSMDISLELWKLHVTKVMVPDLKTTEKQRRWLGYSLKITYNSLLNEYDGEDAEKYTAAYIEVLRNVTLHHEGIFIFLDTVLSMPLDHLLEVNVNNLISFVTKVYHRQNLEIRLSCLRVLDYLTSNEQTKKLISPYNQAFLEEVTELLANEQKQTSFIYLCQRVRSNMGMDDALTLELTEELKKIEDLDVDFFRDDLKVGTPWIIKVVNIEMLTRKMERDESNDDLFYVITHFANILKVSEIVSVKHMAGRGILRLFGRLEYEQRNEIAVELLKGLEIDNYEFSKYLPEYLGKMALMLHPKELNEFIDSLKEMLIEDNEKTASVALETLGIILANYKSYKEIFNETDSDYDSRLKNVLGIYLGAMANYNDVIRHEAFMMLSHFAFHIGNYTLEEKFNIFKFIYKKMLILVSSKNDVDLPFFYNSAALNNIYRFITDYFLENGEIDIPRNKKVAFFPGAFDPFSLGHKAIVTKIRDMGFDVYLAIDEFSWSKKTQPRDIRRNIIQLSVADEEGVYIFPENIPINIANNKDLDTLRSIFNTDELYLVVGTDVIANASTYRKEKTENSIHHMNHIIFKRGSYEDGRGGFDQAFNEKVDTIDGKVIELQLPMHLEDVSSTRIRDNIDSNREISSLIDPVAQNYIYKYGLYVREPQFKTVAEKGKFRSEFENLPGEKHEKEFRLIENIKGEDRVIGHAFLGRAVNAKLINELPDPSVAAYVRTKSAGNLLVIREFDTAGRKDEPLSYTYQVMLTEILAKYVAKSYVYACYVSKPDDEFNDEKIEVLKLQGFKEIIINGEKTGVYGVDMRNPVVVFHDLETVIKNPFKSNQRVLNVIRKSYVNLQKAMVNLFDDTLIFAIDATVMNEKIIDMITEENKVSKVHEIKGERGEYMCVPFGKILNGMVVPNTVTKTLHVEKYYTPDVSEFDIRESMLYAKMENQIKTIKSFDKPVILVDDIIHKGYRIMKLDPILSAEGVDVHKIIVGVLSGLGRDVMFQEGREVDGVYYVPNVNAWFVESNLYPFIGGDGLDRGHDTYTEILRSINFIMPYVFPSYLSSRDKKEVLDYSLTCLKNAYNIFKVLEEEYQAEFQKKLTINDIPTVIRFSKLPDVGGCLDYDYSLAPTDYIKSDIEKLTRLRGLITE